MRHVNQKSSLLKRAFKTRPKQEPAPSREHAVKTNNPRYTGRACPKCQEHTRYTCDTSCAKCRTFRQRRRKRPDEINHMIAIDHLKPEPTLFDDYYTLE
jgi:hypothetical protein